jgi:hypothetical protein
MPSGRSVSTSVDTDMIVKHGIEEGNEFEILIFQSMDGDISHVVRKLQPSEETPNFDI